MKSGEILLNISRKDIKNLFVKTLGIEYNNLCPFADALKDESEINPDTKQINDFASNQNAVYLLKNLAKPVSLIQIRIGGPGEKYRKLSIVKIEENKFIMVIFDGDSYGIQYYGDKSVLTEILDSLVINPDAEEGIVFPDSFPFEALVMYLGIIDSVKYLKYRDSLNHRHSSLLKITAEEFSKLIKGEIEKFDNNWVLSCLMFLLPAVTGFELKGNREIYDELFNNGYLISVSDNRINESSLLLDTKSYELGSEFLELWVKSAGIQISFLENGKIETYPAAFIAVTGVSNHTFFFENGKDKIIYRNYLPVVTPNIFIPMLDRLKYCKPYVEANQNIKSIFCSKCGTPLKEGAKFCGKCGNSI